VNKNTLVAFVLIALTVIFFNSSLWNNFWYGKVLKKPVPTLQTSKQRAAAQEAAQAASGDAKDTSTIKIIPPGSDNAAPAAGKDSGAVAEADTAAAVQFVADTLTVETNRLIAAVSTMGGRIISLKMKDYGYAPSVRKKGLVDLLPDGSEGGAQLSINNESFDSVFFTVVRVDTGRGAAQTIVLEAKSSSGKALQKEFSFADDTYRIGYVIRGEAVVGRKVTVGWAGGIEDSEASNDVPFGGTIDKRRAHYSDGRSVDHFEMSKRGKEEPSGNFRWVGVSSKYFFVALVADSLRDADIVIEGRNAARPSGSPKDKDVDINYSVYYKADATTSEVCDWIYAGPGKVGELSRHGMKFEKTLFPVLSWVRHIFWAGWWFPPIAEIILRLLIYFHQLLKDYGIAIFLLTLLSKIVTYPLTQSSNRSMMRMRDLQPKIAALRQKYGKGNQQKFSEEMMALYKAEGINPLNPGCLPMFLQMPIFIALFVVLRKAVELRAATTYLIPWVKDLSQPEALFHLPFAIPFYGTNVALMPILMAALTFFQQKQAIQDPNQKAMVYMMPVIMLVMFNGFPAGVVFYWTLSSALGLVQQKWLLPKPAPAPVAVEHHKAPVKKVGSHHAGGGKKSPKKR
jgi:YidC/Oxa1 family membrane protein insertase